MSKAQELIKKEGLVGMIITDPYNMRHIRNIADIPESRFLQNVWKKKKAHWQSDTKISRCFAASSTR